MPPRSRLTVASCLVVVVAASILCAAERAGAQVGYGGRARRESEPDTAGAAARKAAEEAAAAEARRERQTAPRPEVGTPPSVPAPDSLGAVVADSLSPPLAAADSLAASSPDSLRGRGVPGLEPGVERRPPSEVDSRAAATPPPPRPEAPLPVTEPAAPADEARLIGPREPPDWQARDPEDRGRFGLWHWVPADDWDAGRRGAGRFGGEEIPERYLLGRGAGLLSRDVDLDLDRGVVLRSSRFENVVIREPRPEPIDDFAYERIFLGRWDKTAEEMRTFVGQNVEGGFGDYTEGQGLTLTAPVSYGPAEAVLGKGASITIRGQERISISGTSRWDANPPPGENFRQSKFPQLDLRQDLNIKVDGKIGDKVSIDWAENSNQDTPLSNRISIRYQGYEDEVVKSVDLGNTNLALPGTQFVSYNGQHQGLFGIKTASQFGDIGLTVIASKQEGQTASNRFVGYAQETTFPLYDIDYVQRRFFFLVDPVDPLLTGQFLPVGEGGTLPPEITDIQLWRDDRNQQNNGSAVPGFVLLNPTGSEAAEDSLETFLDPLVEQDDYTIRRDLFSLNDGQNIYQYVIIDLLSSISRNDILAATFTATYQTDQGPIEIRYGSLRGAETVRAKALYIPDAFYETDGEGFFDRASYWYPARRLELKNIYGLRTTNLDLETLKLSVRLFGGEDRENFPGNETATYLRGLGLDRQDIQGDPGFDDQIDREFVYPSLGLIILPDLRPFAPAAEDSVWPFFRRSLPEFAIDPNEIRPAFFVGDDANRAAYDKRSDAPNRSLDRRYFLNVAYSTPQTQFTLNAPGTILEDSESVVVNGEVLQRGTDYTIDYESGFVNLLGQRQLPENAQIAIDYAYAPLFALGQKTLMGFHVGWDPGVQGRRLGTTWLFESSGSPDRRPKLGEEPSRTIVGDVNGGFQSKPLFLNRMVAAIPGVRPNADSRLDVSAELGLSLPNPNTRGQVYIDDFEGVKDNSVLSLQRDDWFWSSIPQTILDAWPSTNRRGGLIWYNPVISPVLQRDLFPELDPEEGNDRKSVFMVEVNPRVMVTPGSEPVLDPDSWVGITQGISSTGADFTRKQFIEIWVNDFQDPEIRSGATRPRIHIDLGNISEDAQWIADDLPNGRRDTEDRNGDGLLDRSDLIFEDTGLDSLESVDEPGYDPVTNPDPNDDDFDFDRDVAEEQPNNPRLFERINRFELNAHLEDEDINRDNALQRSNNYFEYTIDLSDDTLYVATDVCRDFGECGSTGAENGVNGWRLFRIPIGDGTRVGSPSLSSVRHLRLWFTGFPDTKLLQLGTVDILGNQYKAEVLRKYSIGDPDSLRPVNPQPLETFRVRAINNKEDANEYVPPFELEVQNRVTEREQSLAIDFENLEPRNEAGAFKALANDRDFTLYQTLKWYIFGGELNGSLAADVEAFVRLGVDTLNYYEYAVPIQPGWIEEAIPITELSALKLDDPDSCVVGTAILPCGSLRRGDGRLLRYVGQPTLTRVRRLSFGVRNVAGGPRTGSVWFGDLRLDDVIRDAGLATRFEINTGFADLMSISANFLTRDEDFLSIGSGGQRTVTRGSGSLQRNLNLRTTTNLHKFVETTGLQLPFAFNYARQSEFPLFRAGSDVVLSSEDSRLQERGSEQIGYSINFSRQSRGSGPLLKYTLDGFRGDFSLSDRKSLSQTRRDSARTINLGLAYSVSPAFRPLKLGRSEIRYFPDNVSLGARLGSSRTFSFNRDLDDPDNRELISSVFQKDANLNGSTSFTFLRSLRSSYRIDSRRDLNFVNPAGWLGGLNIGQETRRSQSLDVNWNPPLWQRLAPNLSFRGGSLDDHGPTLQQPTDDKQVRNISASQTLSASFSIPITLLTGQGGAVPPGDSTAGVMRRFQGQIGRVGRFQDVRTSLSANNAQDFSYVTGVPRWLYQLGLSTHPGPDIELTDRGREGSTKSRGAQFSTSFEFNLGIAVSSSYNWSTREQVQSFTTPRGGRTVTWPQVDVDWRSFQTRLPRLDKLFRSLNLESRYTRDRSETGPLENVSQNITDRRDWNPLVGVNGTLASGWTLRARVSSTTTRNNDNEAGLGRFDNTIGRRYQLTLSRRFDRATGLKFPWMKEPIKLSSDLTFNVDVSYSTDRSESGRRGQAAIINRDTSSTSIRTGTSYKFRRNISGDFSINLGRNNNNKSGQKLRTIALSGAIIFTF